MADELRRRGVQTADMLFSIACGYALCVPAADSKPTNQGGDADQPQQQPYVAASIECLRLAIDQGYKDIGALERDPDLDPVRGNAEFQKLLQSVKQDTTP
jgi:hypothetical protein